MIKKIGWLVASRMVGDDGSNILIILFYLEGKLVRVVFLSWNGGGGMDNMFSSRFILHREFTIHHVRNTMGSGTSGCFLN